MQRSNEYSIVSLKKCVKFTFGVAMGFCVSIRSLETRCPLRQLRHTQGDVHTAYSIHADDVGFTNTFTGSKKMLLLYQIKRACKAIETFKRVWFNAILIQFYMRRWRMFRQGAITAPLNPWTYLKSYCDRISKTRPVCIVSKRPIKPKRS